MHFDLLQILAMDYNFLFVFAGLISTLTLWIAATTIYTGCFTLRGINGPLLARFSRLWMVLALVSEDCANWYLATNEKYGKHDSL